MGLFDFLKKKETPTIVPAETMMERASKGTIRNAIYGSTYWQTGQSPPENFNVFLRSYQKDPIVQSAITVRTDAILHNWFSIEGSPTAKTKADKLLDEIGFNDYTFFQQLCLNGLLYEHVFIEIVRDGNGNPKEVHILETPFMEIKHDEHGEIEEYILRSESSNNPVRFPPEDITYIKFNNVSTAVWGEVGIKSLYRTLYTKNQIEKFIEEMAAMNAWRQVLNTTMSDANIQDFLAYYSAAQADSTMPLIMQRAGNSNKDDTSLANLRDPAELKEFLSTLDYFRSQALMFFKVPPIMVGLPDSSNRSNSEAQIKAFHISNQAFQKKVSDGMNNDLFQKLGLSTVEFSWNPIDKRNEKDDMEIAERLMNMGADPKIVEKFIRNTGLELPEGKLFTNPNVKKSEDMFPSRQRKAEGEMSEQIGTGEDGTSREEQTK